MERFKSILVGVGLSDGDQLVSDTMPVSSREAVARAVWLAKTTSAEVTFFLVLPTWAPNLDAETQLLLQEGHGGRTVFDHAKEVMARLVDEAKREGIQANSRVAIGKRWVEIIRQQIRKKHDLVIVGGRESKADAPFLTGTTAIKLLRKCPCAVWVTKPAPDPTISSILVAHDLRPVGDLAMELGCSMAQLHNAELHVLHAAEYPEHDSVLSSSVSAESAASYRLKAEQYIEAQLKKYEVPKPVRVHFSTRTPDFAIWHCIEDHEIELLVMGTIGRSGIRGFITGNSAERLLPLVPCSILAVKPAGFQSPVTLVHAS
jgi:universal stress protein E